MNRYTYKAQRKDKHGWVTGNLIYNISTDKYFIDYSIIEDISSTIREFDKYNYGLHLFVAEINPSTLCQCTGLRNIFEHDLVKYKDEKEIYKVVWYEQGYWGLKGEGPRNEEMLCYADIFDSLELIGNKFDKEG